MFWTLFMLQLSWAIQRDVSNDVPLNSSWNTRFQLPLGPRGFGVADAETVVGVDVVVGAGAVVCPEVVALPVGVGAAVVAREADTVAVGVGVRVLE
jgi:hypothetical protein